MTYSTIGIAARRALLDALVALRPHRDALVLVGSQAIYLYTGDADVPIATTTKDSDIVVLPQMLGGHPLLDDAMKGAGFHQGLQGRQGQWLNRAGILSICSSLQRSNQAVSVVHAYPRTTTGRRGECLDSRPRPSTGRCA